MPHTHTPQDDAGRQAPDAANGTPAEATAPSPLSEPLPAAPPATADAPPSKAELPQRGSQPDPTPPPLFEQPDGFTAADGLDDTAHFDDPLENLDPVPLPADAPARRRSPGRTILFWCLLAVCVVVLAFALTQFIQIQWGYKVAVDEYDRLQELYYPAAVPPAPADDTSVAEPEPLELWEINPDYVGWIEIPGTVVSYPVVLGANNDRYLNHTFEGVQNGAGTIFADYRNSRDFSSPHTVIYGHNLKNGRMFGGLHQYLDDVYTRKNQMITLYTPDATLTYRIFSARVTDMYDPSYRLDFADDSEISAFIASYGGPADATRMLTLSTCTDNDNDDERLLVHAALESVGPATA